MRTVFAEPSRTYSIILSKEDVVKLVTGGLLYQPIHTENTYMNAPGKVTDADGHFLQYHGPEAGTIPVQFVNICLQKRG